MTIEELREGVIVGLRTLGLEKGLDTLIAAAHAEGFAEGVEDTTADLALVQDTETFAKGRAEGAEQIKAMNVGIVTYRDGILGLTEGHDLRYPLVQGATYVLIRVCVTDGAMDGHATMKPASVFAPKEPEVKP